MIKFEIPIQPRTKKNSSQIIFCKGRPMIIPSKLFTQYQNDCKWFMPKIPTITTPINLKCIYYMGTRRRVDLVNLLEATCDILVNYKIIEDDNSSIVVSHDGSRVFYNKEKPRCEIEIEFL